MSLKQLIVGSYKCHLGHDHSNNEDLTQCNAMEQKRRDQLHETEADQLQLEQIKEQGKNEAEKRKHEKEMMEMNIELERMRQENYKNENALNNPKSKICSVM